MIAAVNGTDVTSKSYNEIVNLLKNAPRPMTLTVRSQSHLEAKEEADEALKIPSKNLQNTRPAPNEFELKLRNLNRSDVKIVRSGQVFIILSVNPKCKAAKRGLHADDEIVGVNAKSVKGWQVKGTLAAIYKKKVTRQHI